MGEVFIWILILSFPLEHLRVLRPFLRDVSRILQASVLLIGGLEGIPNLNKRGVGPRNTSLDPEERPGHIDIDDHELLTDSRLASQSPSHLLSFEDLTWVFCMSDGSWLPMGFGVTVGVELLSEVPSFDGSRESFSFRGSDYVHILSDLEMSRAEHVSERQQILMCDPELSEILLMRHLSPQTMAQDRLLHMLMAIHLPSPDLDRIIAFLRDPLDMCDLIPINEQHRRRMPHSPPIVELGHTHLISQEA